MLSTNFFYSIPHDAAYFNVMDRKGNEITRLEGGALGTYQPSWADKSPIRFINNIARLSLRIEPFIKATYATGNEGVEMDLQYRTAAFIIQPKQEQ